MEEKNKLGDNREHGCKMCETVSAIHGKVCTNGGCSMFMKTVMGLIVLGVVLAIGFRLGKLESFSSRGYYRLPINCYMLNR